MKTLSNISVKNKEEKKIMQAAVITEPRTVEMQAVPIPEPADDEVRVRLEGCGLCASDLPVWEGRTWFSYPRKAGSPGHEAWGRVDAVGKKVKTVRPGYRITGLFYNAYAEYDIAREKEVVELPASLNDQPFPGEPLGCAANIFQRCSIEHGDTVAIIGIGWLGSLLVQMARHAGATVIALSRRTSSLEKAAELGADYTFPIEDHEEITDRVETITGGDFCDCVIEAAGKQETLDLAGRITGIRGRLVIAGYHQEGRREVDMQLWNWRGIDVINAHERDPAIYVQGMRKAITYISKGILDPFPLLTHTFPFSDIGNAFVMQQQKPEGFNKAILRFD